MKVSVIVSTYNKAGELARVLEGLRAQLILPHEVIVADDGSGPETAALVESFKREGFPCPLLHVWDEDKGFRLAFIRNKAIKSATGEYAVIMDGDCIVGRHFTGDHLRLAEEGYFVQGKRVMVGRETSSYITQGHINSRAWLFRAFVSGGLSNVHHLIRLPWLPALRKTSMRGIKGCNMAFHMGDLRAVNGYNEDFTGWGREDSELAARLYNLGVKRKEHPFMAACFHLWHEDNQRTRLDENDRILRNAIASGGHWCPNGIIKGEGPS